MTFRSYPRFPGGSFSKEFTCNGRRLPAVEETQVQSLGPEDPLEKEMASHTSIPSCLCSMDRGTWWATVHGFTRAGHDLVPKLPSPSPNMPIGTNNDQFLFLISYPTIHTPRILLEQFKRKLLSEREITKTIPFTVSLKTVAYLGTNLMRLKICTPKTIRH